MNFDPILDKQLIDFQFELDRIRRGRIAIFKSKLFRCLTSKMQRATLAAREMPRMLIIIRHAYGYDEIKPDSIRSQNSVWTTELKNQWNHKFGIEDANFHQQWLKLEKITTDSMEGILAVSFLATVKRFHSRFGIGDFLFTSCFLPRGDTANRALSVQKVFNKMKESRLNFILRGSYLPIVIFQNGDRHATTVLMIPKVVIHNTGHWLSSGTREILNWHIILINSNSDDLFVNRVSVPLQACEFYKLWVGKNQQFSETTHTKSYCWENIQKHFGTCAYWSLFIALFISRNSDKFDVKHPRKDIDWRSGDGDGKSGDGDDKGKSGDGKGKSSDGDEKSVDKVARFCKMLSEKTKNPETIYRFHGYIQDMRFATHTLLTDAVDNWKMRNGIKIQIDQLPPTIDFFQELLNEPEHNTVSLLIAIMNYVFADLDRYEHLNRVPIGEIDEIYTSKLLSPRPDTQRWNEKMQMASWEQTEHQTSQLMEVLFKLFKLIQSEKTTSESKSKHILDFRKIFERFFIFFDDFEELHDWMKHWFFEKNKTDRLVLRKEQRNLLLLVSHGKSEFSDQLLLVGEKLKNQIIETDTEIKDFIVFAIETM